RSSIGEPSKFGPAFEDLGPLTAPLHRSNLLVGRGMVEALFIGAVVPAFVLLFSLGVRYYVTRRLPPSAGADWLLSLIAFDIGALYAKEQMLPLIHHAQFASFYSQVWGVLIFLTSMVWLFAAFGLEPVLSRRRPILLHPPAPRWKIIHNRVRRFRE